MASGFVDHIDLDDEPLGNLGLFVSTWKTDNSGGVSNNDQILLPLEPTGTYDFVVDWGDSSSDLITAWDQPEVTHTYAAPGTFKIMIDGAIDGFKFGNAGDRGKIIEISTWGPLLLGDNDGYFYGAANLVITAVDVLDTSDMTNFTTFFRDCTSITTIPNVGNWDVRNVTAMGNMFRGATVFNGSIGGWGVGTANVVNMSSMFQGAAAFNQNIGGWDVSSVLFMAEMFEGATVFNGDIGNWNVLSVTEITSMFSGAVAFNQEIGGWDVSNVVNMVNVFFGATAFNGDIGDWDVSNALFMVNMFRDATAFDQDLSNWVVSSVTVMLNMFLGSGFSTTNYDLLLVAWDLLTLQNGVSFHAGSAQFNAGAPATARANIISNFSWSITDGGPV